MSTLTVKNPYSGKAVGECRTYRRSDVERALVTLRGAAPLATRARADILREAARLLGQEKQAFALRISQESGISLRESALEVERACGNLSVASEEAERIVGECIPLAGKLALTLWEPIGVVGAITPFNRPLNQVVVKVAPAVAAGCPVLVKPSDKTPLSALAFAELMERAGLPPGHLLVLPGDPNELGGALIDGVDMVTFTGSVETGEQVARRAGAKPILLELGGNDVLVVLADADLELAAKLASKGAFATAGQSCRGVKRILVDEDVADAFVERLSLLARAMKVGDPMDPMTEIGTLIDEAAATKVEQLCQAALRSGASLVCGGERNGALFQPTVLDFVRPEMELVAHETFGPVAPVIRTANIEEVIDIANGTPYGLQAGVVTDSLSKFTRLAKALKVGAVNAMDGPNFDSPHIPFGGVKKSGVGREGVRFAIREMSSLKTVVVPW
jgi:aldehyde dehydrogenase (NAD+)/aldehyde dehydrogenase